MRGPNSKRQKTARRLLESLSNDAKNVWVIHYSCESFYDRTNPASPRITSIAIRKLDSGQTLSFSIHQVAEEKRIDFADIESHYDDLELSMLAAFYDRIRQLHERTFIHWNMRDVNYGFAALEHRFRVLGGEPYIIPDEKRVDLSTAFINIYGVAYIGHPRLQRLMEKNSIHPKDVLNGRCLAPVHSPQG